MRTPSLIAAFLACTGALAATADAAAATAPPAASSLRGHDCLDPSFARSYTDLDHRRLLVDTGRNRYLIEVTPSCLDLGIANVIGFRGDPINNRVCGGVMDAVLVRNSVPCRIERMVLLSKEEYRQALHDREQGRRQRKAGREAAKQR
jgi:hypothetical protein